MRFTLTMVLFALIVKTVPAISAQNQGPFFQAAKAAYAADRFTDAITLSQITLSSHPENEEALSILLRAGLQVSNAPDTLFERWDSRIRASQNPLVWQPFILHHIRAHRIDTAEALLATMEKVAPDKLTSLGLRSYLAYHQKNDEKLAQLIPLFLVEDKQADHLDFIMWILYSWTKEKGKENLLGLPVFQGKEDVSLFLRSIVLDDPKKSPAMATEAGLLSMKEYDPKIPFITLYGATQALRGGNQKPWKKLITYFISNAEGSNLDVLHRFLTLALSSIPHQVSPTEGYLLGVDVFDQHDCRTRPKRDFLLQWFDSCEVALVHSKAEMFTQENVWSEYEPVTALYLVPGMCATREQDKTILMQQACTRLFISFSQFEPLQSYEPSNHNAFLPWALALVLKKHQKHLTQVPNYLKDQLKLFPQGDLRAMAQRFDWQEVSFYFSDRLREQRFYYLLGLLDAIVPLLAETNPDVVWPATLQEQLLEWRRLSYKPGYVLGLSEHQYFNKLSGQWDLEHFAYAMHVISEQYQE